MVTIKRSAWHIFETREGQGILPKPLACFPFTTVPKCLTCREKKTLMADTTAPASPVSNIPSDTNEKPEAGMALCLSGDG
jgi:hypothetical protein